MSEKWNTRLTVTPTKRPHKNRTSSRIQDIKKASKQAGAIVVHDSNSHDTLRAYVNAVLTKIWGTTTNVRNRIHDIHYYVESLQNVNTSETLFIQSLWDLAILHYIQKQNIQNSSE